MKKILLTIAAIALFAAPASAQMYSVWADETMTACEFHTAAAYVPFTVYLILEPGPTGAFGSEYMFTMPATIIAQETNPSPAIAVAMGDAVNGTGISLGFSTCQNETFWIYNWVMLPLATAPGYFEVVPHADTGKLIIAECTEPLRPELDASVYNYFGFNDACVVGTKESSWGAIKSMMD